MCQKFSDLTEVVVVVVLLIVIILRKYSGKNLTHNLLPHTMVLLLMDFGYTYTAARAHKLSSMLVIIYKLFSHLRKRCGTFSLRIKLQLLSSFAKLK